MAAFPAMARALLRTLIALHVGLLAGCTDEAPRGIAVVRLSDLPGSCPVKDACGSGAPTANGAVLDGEFPYVRSRAVASFQASSRFTGGAAIAVGWKDEAGQIGLVQAELSPTRGYGIALVPETTREGDPTKPPQAVGYGLWKDGALVFTPKRFIGGFVNYLPGPRDDGAAGPLPPSKAYVLLITEGVNAAGETRCQVVAVHASADRERTEPWDPDWLRMRPQMLSLAGREAPTFAGVAAPTAVVQAVEQAPADPGGSAPFLTQASYGPSCGFGGSSPCD